jgi:hypothetical protein
LKIYFPIHSIAYLETGKKPGFFNYNWEMNKTHSWLFNFFKTRYIAKMNSCNMNLYREFGENGYINHSFWQYRIKRPFRDIWSTSRKRYQYRTVSPMKSMIVRYKLRYKMLHFFTRKHSWSPFTTAPGCVMTFDHCNLCSKSRYKPNPLYEESK